MRIPDEVRKCVVYLGLEESIGSTMQKKYRGTGFFVGIQSTKIPGASYLYLVTAKHVATKLIGKTFYVRLNTTNGKSLDIPCNPSRWWFHPTDDAADVAILPLGLDQQKFEFVAIPSEMFLTEVIRKLKGIGAGDEIFITGLFVHHKGNAKNIPIMRMGNIAMVPDERIPITNFGDMEAYLIEARSIGGLSGSPVFVIEVVDPLDRRIHLLGLIQGHWDVKPETIIDEATEDSETRAGVNVGIAIVTPASKILEIINCNEMQKLRDDLEASQISKA